MQTASSRGIRKRARVPNACIRCRQQKIKCSGTRPCEQCSKRSAVCRFESSTHKILVDARFIERLQRQAARGSSLAQHQSEFRGLTPPGSGQNEDEDENGSAFPLPCPIGAQANAGPSVPSDSNALIIPQPRGSDIQQQHQRPAISDIPQSSNLNLAGLGQGDDGDLDMDTDDGSLLGDNRSFPQDSSTPDLTAINDDDSLRQRGTPSLPRSSHPGDSLISTAALGNPLLPGNSPSFIVDPYGQPGTSSNWSFGRRVLGMVHERVSGTTLPSTSLLFDGSTYDLGWDGLREGTVIDRSSLPTADYALFLINAVKFHCTPLFHVFDEEVFMRQFYLFHENSSEKPENPPILWFIHYLLILAFGKAFIVRTGKGRSPPGADLFVRAMKLLPDITFLCTDPIQSVEVLICVALYFQCIDIRNAAYNVIGQAVRLAVEQGMHTGMLGHHSAEKFVNRCRSAWWTVYILDRRMSCISGSPVSIADADITATLPTLSDSAERALALSHHVQLSKATSIILHTVYSKNGTGDNKPFLNSVKDALKTVAQGSDERESVFPLHLDQTSTGLCRLSAYLHLFHHQCLVLATRPLLFFFWQRRLESDLPLRVPSEGGARSLLRICVSSSKQMMRILAALQAQSLLDSFLPFDREAALSAATVLVLAAAVDDTLLQPRSHWLKTAYEVFEEMKCRGSIIAGYHKAELQQLEANLRKMHDLPGSKSKRAADEDAVGEAVTSGSTTATATAVAAGAASEVEGASASFENAGDVLNDVTDFSSEDGLLDGNQLQSVAESFNFAELDYWLATGNLEGPLYNM